jgi:nicotinate-nucleotide pyrophosphorylase (carboxylating)
VSKGHQVLRGSAPLTQVLSFERTLLNGMQRWSGVATLTKVCVQAVTRAHESWSASDRVNWPKPLLLHTRKTTPLWRDLEVQGVLAGGGHVHRLSLADRPMVKENHKEPAMVLGGGWDPYLKAVLKAYPDAMIEAETWEEARDAVGLGARALLLDNFSPQELRRHLVPFLAEFSDLETPPVIEVSGGISPSNIEDYVLPGVSRISMGALTHSYRSVDLSLNVLLSDEEFGEGAPDAT